MYVETNLSNPNFIKKLISYDSNLAYRIYDNVKAMVSSDEKVVQENAWRQAFKDNKANANYRSIDANYDEYNSNDKTIQLGKYSLADDEDYKIKASTDYVSNTKQIIGDFINQVGKDNFSWQSIENNSELMQRINGLQGVLDNFGTSNVDYENDTARKALDLNIANEYYNEITKGKTQGNSAFIVIGPPASGKSSVIAKYLINTTGAIEIDSDTIKEMLPEYKQYGGATANYLHEESSNIAESVQDKAMSKGYNIVLPLVGKNTQKISNLIDDLKAKGYDKIELYDVELPTDKTKARAISRFAETGRYLAPSYLDSVGNKPSNTYELLKNKEGVTYYAKYDNDVNFGEKARLIESGGQSITETIENGLGEIYSNGQISSGTSRDGFSGRENKLNTNITDSDSLQATIPDDNIEETYTDATKDAIRIFKNSLNSYLDVSLTRNKVGMKDAINNPVDDGPKKIGVLLDNAKNLLTYTNNVKRKPHMNFLCFCYKELCIVSLTAPLDLIRLLK